MDKATPTPSPASADTRDIVLRLRDTPNWLYESYASWKDSVCKYSRAPFEAADEIERLRAEVERLAAQAAPTEPPQEFESAQGRALASAWAEGWAQCRDAEYVGEEAESEAFNQSATLAQCLYADQTRFQGGLSNDQLRRAWSAKLPNVIPTDEQLTAFALGIEAAAQPLKAEQAKDAAEDAELLDWLEEKHYALHPIKEDQGDDTYTLWWQVTDKDKSISGHPLGNIRAAIRAARAAERKA